MSFRFINSAVEIAMLVSLLCCVSCKKEEIQGPKGEPGTNGTGGNAAMSSSAEFVVAATEWKDVNNVWQYNYSSSLVTSKVVSGGGVKVYMKVAGTWYELPFAEGDILTQFGFSEGKVALSVADIHGGPFAQPATASFRIVTFYDSPRPANTAVSRIQPTSTEAN
jgi:hypothetical protein